MTNLDNILKSRDFTLLTKVRLVKAMVFPVVVYGCEMDHKESWVLKNGCFELWCWRRLLRVPWTARRWNQSILKEISPEYSLEGLMLKLKLQTLATWCKELTHWKRPWCWERLRAGEGNSRGWDSWMASPIQWTGVWASLRSWWWTGKPGWRAIVHGVAKSWTQLNWMEYMSLLLWLGSLPREGNGYSLQYSCLKNSMDRGAQCATVHAVIRSWIQLSIHSWQLYF